MPNEFKHDTVGTSLTEAEWTGIGTHVLDSQATGDTIYAESATQLRRLQVGATDEVLTVSGGIPTWAAITKVGTIGTGTWNADAIDPTFGGTGQSTWTTGDILYADGTNTLAKLGIGTVNQQIRVSAGGIPEWYTASASGASVGLAVAMAIVF
jgi:hypothetical protein